MKPKTNYEINNFYALTNNKTVTQKSVTLGRRLLPRYSAPVTRTPLVMGVSSITSIKKTVPRSSISTESTPPKISYIPFDFGPYFQLGLLLLSQLPNRILTFLFSVAHYQYLVNPTYSLSQMFSHGWEFQTTTNHGEVVLRQSKQVNKSSFEKLVT